MKNGEKQWALGGVKEFAEKIKARGLVLQVRIRPPATCPRQHCPPQDRGASIAEPQQVSQLTQGDPLQVPTFDRGGLSGSQRTRFQGPAKSHPGKMSGGNKRGLIAPCGQVIKGVGSNAPDTVGVVSTDESLLPRFIDEGGIEKLTKN